MLLRGGAPRLLAAPARCACRALSSAPQSGVDGDGRGRRQSQQETWEQWKREDEEETDLIKERMCAARRRRRHTF